MLYPKNQEFQKRQKDLQDHSLYHLPEIPLIYWIIQYCQLPVIKIVSRFYADLPLKMLKRVLAGNDYYENPDMIKIKNYSGIEWRNLLKNNGDNEKGKTEESQNKESDEILFGTVQGILRRTFPFDQHFCLKQA